MAIFRFSLLSSLLLVSQLALAQTCPSPPVNTEKGFNLFSPEQEKTLGEVNFELVRRDYRLIEDEAVTAYLQGIGDRLTRAAGLPAWGVQFLMVDLPDVNAYTLPGGRILVTKKLVAFVRSEDELAGILGHELGHVVARHVPQHLSEQLRRVLNVNAVGDAKDIFEKYHQLIENRMRKPEAFRFDEGRHEREQVFADQLGIYVMARAGYDPAAASTVWDRITENKGKTGSWLSDLFGATKPASRRLREQLRAASALPGGCAEPQPASRVRDFSSWQQAVVAYAGLGRRESVGGLMLKRRLDPPLQADIQNLRFSPDGRYALAQDESSIWVMTREPFAPLFHIPAEDAYDAQFSPDSSEVVFHNPHHRVERWNIGDAASSSVKEVVIPQGCFHTELSPDGKLLSCLRQDFELRLVEVDTGVVVFQKKDFAVPNWLTVLLLALTLDRGGPIRIRVANAGFSPDGHWFAAASAQNVMVMDLTTRTMVKVPGSVQELLRGGFGFLTGGRLIGRNGLDHKKSGIVEFPSGKMLHPLPLGLHRYRASARGDFVMAAPYGTDAVGVIDPARKKIVIRARKEAIDFFDDYFLNEHADGEVAIYRYDPAGAQPVAVARLPRSRFGAVQVAAFSPDFSWLAVSQRTRSAVWDLSNGSRKYHMHSFRGAHFEKGSVLYADLQRPTPIGSSKPKDDDKKGDKNKVTAKEEKKEPAETEAKSLDEIERIVGWLELRSGKANSLLELKTTDRTWQYGPYLASLTSPKGDRFTYREGVLYEDAALEVKDVRTMAVLWSQAYPKEVPRFWVAPRHDTITLMWPVKTATAKALINGNPGLKRQQASLREKDGDYLVQVRDIRNGATKGMFLMETGKASFRVVAAQSAEDWVVFADSENRVLLYSLATGEQKGRMAGSSFALSPDAKKICVRTDSGRLNVFDLQTVAKKAEYSFSNDISFVQFAGDGARLFVLTADQTAYVLDLNATVTAQDD